MPEAPPPANVQAEDAVIGCLLHEPDSYSLIEDLRPEEFYSCKNAQIYGLIRDRIVGHLPLDVILVAPELIKRGVIESIVELSSYESRIPSYARLPEYAAQVKTTSTARGLIQLGIRLAEEAQRGDPMDAAANAADALRSVSNSAGMKDPIPFSQSLHEYIDEKAVAAHPTGIRDLDESMNGGLHWGGIILVGGESKAGKTLLVLEMIRNCMRYHTPVYAVSRDQLHRHISGRLWAGEAGVDRSMLRSSIKASDIVPVLEKWPLYFHPSSFDLSTIIAYIKISVATKGIRVWVVDYLQRITTDGFDKAEKQYVYIADRLSDLAQDTNTCGLVISRVTKPNPGMSSQHRFAGEAGVTNSCDGMLFIHKCQDENADDALAEAFFPNCLRMVEVIGGRYWGDGHVMVRMDGSMDRYRGMEHWGPTETQAWEEYRRSK